MIGYPTNSLLMLIDDPDRDREAIRELAAAGFGPDRVSVLVGEPKIPAYLRR